MSLHSQNRRSFIRNTSSLFAFSYLKYSGLGKLDFTPKRRVALIGTGWYGKSDLFRLMQVEPTDVVGICDVDGNQLKQASELISQRIGNNKRIPLYQDYRKLLSEEKPEIVLIGTPDHWHALQTIDALKSGSHVYVQKPISVDVMEGEAMLAAARKYDRVVQVGTQRRSTPHLIEAKKNIVDTGMLGKVLHVEMCCYYHMRNSSNPPIQAVPDFFDYDSWTGPAPLRPFTGLPHRGDGDAGRRRGVGHPLYAGREAAHRPGRARDREVAVAVGQGHPARGPLPGPDRVVQPETRCPGQCVGPAGPAHRHA